MVDTDRNGQPEDGHTVVGFNSLSGTWLIQTRCLCECRWGLFFSFQFPKRDMVDTDDWRLV